MVDNDAERCFLFAPATHGERRVSEGANDSVSSACCASGQLEEHGRANEAACVCV